MDLVEVSPNADPPVCKVMDYGKYLFELQNVQLEFDFGQCVGKEAQ